MNHDEKKSTSIPLVRQPSSSLRSRFLMVSEDGRIRLSFAELISIRFTHLISGLDEGCAEAASGDVSPTTICGYTEWISDCDPRLSIGWDWLIHGRNLLRRISEPRSNLMLQTNLMDVGHVQLPALLGEFVDTLKWQSIVLSHITSRYR